MTRRAFVLALVAMAAHVRETQADLVGTARMHRADERCRRAGKRRERHGITARERAYLEDHLHCQELDGEWRTALVFQAGD